MAAFCASRYVEDCTRVAVIIEVWLSFHDIAIVYIMAALLTITKLSVHGTSSHCKHVSYMTVIKLCDEG